METRKIWLRLGVTLTATKEEIESLFNADTFDATLCKLVKENKFEVDGDSYIPERSVELYNETYKENYEVKEY